MKRAAATSALKKAVVALSDGSALPGYLSPARLGRSESCDLISPDGEHREITLSEVRAVYFVNDLAARYEPERKAFLSRPKLDGLWVRLKFRDNEVLEGVVPNDLLALLDAGVQITPPDLQGNTQRIFIPRSALAQITVLGVVGVARRKPAAPAPAAQPKLFGDS